MFDKKMSAKEYGDLLLILSVMSLKIEAISNEMNIMQQSMLKIQNSALQQSEMMLLIHKDIADFVGFAWNMGRKEN